MANAEIAARLVISPKTAEHHVGRILRKLGLKSRGEATAFAVRDGRRRTRRRIGALPDESGSPAGTIGE